jgi:hypothetical protein
MQSSIVIANRDLTNSSPDRYGTSIVGPNKWKPVTYQKGTGVIERISDLKTVSNQAIYGNTFLGRPVAKLVYLSAFPGVSPGKKR